VKKKAENNAKRIVNSVEDMFFIVFAGYFAVSSITYYCVEKGI
jgi:hypothetical protein